MDSKSSVEDLNYSEFRLDSPIKSKLGILFGTGGQSTHNHANVSKLAERAYFIKAT
jgi:hypothetical protein